MDVFLIILRLLHVGGAIFWTGAGLFNYLFLEPAMALAGAGAGAVQQNLIRNTRITVAMPVSAILTILSGLILFWRDSNGLDIRWLQTGTGVMFTIGALAGIAMMVVGGGMTGSINRRMGALRGEIAQSGGVTSPQQSAEIAALQSRRVLLGHISFVLMIVAIVTMATARYF